MPYYTYKCVECGAQVDLRMKMTDERPEQAPIQCPSCSKETTGRRHIGPFAFAIKGEKWS